LPHREHRVDCRQGRQHKHGRLLLVEGGIIGITKSIAKEVASERICVDAVSPAVIRTKILNQLTPPQMDYMVQRIPIKRTGKLEGVAAVVHFLANRDCSFITCQCYDASEGCTTY
jgi:3-oxoacyl-[acyl-carrier protein] reductase